MNPKDLDVAELSTAIRHTHIGTLRQQDLNNWAAMAERVERERDEQARSLEHTQQFMAHTTTAVMQQRDRLHAQRDWLIAVVIGLLAGLGYAGIRLAQDQPRAAPSELTGDPENVVQLDALRIGPEPLRAPGGNVYAL